MTIFGVALHDTQVDKFTTVAIGLPAAIITYEGISAIGMHFGEQHTHVESVSLGHAVQYAAGRMPGKQPRMDEDKRYRLERIVVRGQHSFDGYHIPLA